MSTAGIAVRGREWVRRRFTEPERPMVAIEIHASSVGVLRLRRDKRGLAVGAAAVAEIPAGTIALSLTQPNVVDPARLRQAMLSALERAGVLGGARVALVLPDTVAKVTLVPAVEVDTGKGTSADEILRFRLRKSIPFEVRDARLAHASPGGRANDAYVVVAAAGPVVGAYEETCRSLGLEPGQVEIASLALTRAAFPPGSAGDGLLVNWDEGYTSIVLTRDGWPILVRTLSGSAVATTADVRREVASTLVYYRERLGGAGVGAAFVRSVVEPAVDAAAGLAAAVGFTPAVLDAWRGIGGMAGEASQPLAAAAAALGAAE